MYVFTITKYFSVNVEVIYGWMRVCLPSLWSVGKNVINVLKFVVKFSVANTSVSPLSFLFSG